MRIKLSGLVLFFYFIIITILEEHLIFYQLFCMINPVYTRSYYNMNINIDIVESPTRHKKRIEILNSAYELFVKNGIKDVSMQQIADAAGIEHRTLYTYYKDKEQIATDLMMCRFNNVHLIQWDAIDFKNTYEKFSYYTNLIYDYLVSDPNGLLFTVYFSGFYSQSNTAFFDYVHKYINQIDKIDWEEKNAIDHSINAIFANNLAHHFHLLIQSINALLQTEVMRQARFDNNSFDFSKVAEFKELMLELIKA